MLTAVTDVFATQLLDKKLGIARDKEMKEAAGVMLLDTEACNTKHEVEIGYMNWFVDYSNVCRVGHELCEDRLEDTKLYDFENMSSCLAVGS